MGRGKPYDPNKAASDAALAAEKKARKLEIERLRTLGATVTLDRGGHVMSAFRSNVFNLLLTRKAITQNQHDAAYRLAQDWAAWKGLDGGAENRAEVVDGGSGCAELVTQRMIEAGNEVARVIIQLDRPDRTLITAFMVATVEEDRPMAWRGIVQRWFGDQLGKVGEVAVVVRALESLRCVYEAPRERRAA